MNLRELEPDARQMHTAVAAIMERLVPWVEQLGEMPSWQDEGVQEVLEQLDEPLPEDGRSLSEVLDVLFDQAIGLGINTAGPGYLAYVPGGGIFHAGVADLIANVINRYVGIWLAAPGLVQIETTVLRWLAELVGFPAAAGGVLTTGGSMSIFSALFTARRERLPENFLSGVLYASDQAHHCLQRAATLVGFPAHALRSIPTDSEGKLSIPALSRAIEEDRIAGRQPFFVLANAGTTNTGAIDDLRALSALCAAEGLWLHIDAAYGGFFVLTERGRHLLDGLAEADSITLDPHKGLFLPYGTGALLVRDATTLHRAHAVDADYLPDMQQSSNRIDFCHISPELSRDCRGLRVWLPLVLHGVSSFRRYLDEKLDLARWAATRIEQTPSLELVVPPQLSLFAFRQRLPTQDAATLDAHNQLLLERINQRRRVYLTGTRFQGMFVIRMCILSFRTHQEHVQNAIEDIQLEAAQLLEAGSGQGARPSGSD